MGFRDMQEKLEKKIFRLGNGKYFQFELANWKMTEEKEQREQDNTLKSETISLSIFEKKIRKDN